MGMNLSQPLFQFVSRCPFDVDNHRHFLEVSESFAFHVIADADDRRPNAPFGAVPFSPIFLDQLHDGLDRFVST